MGMTTPPRLDELHIGILGPLDVRRADSVLALGGRQQRVVLALLVLDRGRTVTVDRMADVLWGDRPPSGYVTTIQTYVHHLRAALEPDRPKGAPAEVLLSAPGGGYRLDVPDERIDACRFEALVASGRNALVAGDLQTAATELTQALALWRGEVLSDLPDLAVVNPVVNRLEEARLAATEDWAAAELGLGRHGALVPELSALVEAHPLREPLTASLILALYRSGRQADALAAYRRIHQRLDDELGVQPGPQLRSLHQRVLRQDPALDQETKADTAYADVAKASQHDVQGHKPAPRMRTRWVRVGAVALLAVALVVGSAVWVKRSQTTRPLPANSVAALGPHGLIGDAVDVGAVPVALAEAAGSVWVLNQEESTVARVDPESRRVTQTIPDVGEDPQTMASSGDDIWVAAFGSGLVTRISTTANKVVDRVTVGSQPAALVAGAGAVWVANSGDNTVQRIDGRSGKAGPPLPVGDGPSALALDGTTLWVANGRNATVSQIDIRTGERAAPDAAVDSGPGALALTSTDVWVANTLSETVSRIDRATGRVARIAVADGPSSLAVTDDGVWVSDTYAGSMSLIDPATNSVTTVNVHSSPHGVARVGDEVWVASSAFATAEHVGGTLTVGVSRPFDSIDPASAYQQEDVQAFTPVYDGLVTFRGGGPISSEVLVPDLATDIPRAVDGGKTYVFTVRQGIQYSDGRSVVASDLARGVRRALLAGATFERGIIGAQHCLDNPQAPESCDLSAGVVADDASGRLTFHLTAPDPEFLYKLTLFVVATPPGTPDTDVGANPIPSTGPYQISELRPDGSVTLVRNPKFHAWSVAAQPAGYPDVIQIRVEKDEATAVDDVLGGAVDLTRSLSRFDLATSLPTRAHISLEENTDFLYLNASLPPFDHKEVRQALNYAVDRRVLAARYPGGAGAASPSCQMLPPGFPAYRPYCPYQTGPADGPYLGPDLAKAKALVEQSATTHIPITIHRFVGSGYEPFPDYIAEVLRSLGYAVSIEDFPVGTANGDPTAPVYRGFQVFNQWGWIPDYPGPSSFFNFVGSCRAPNFNQFCDPQIEAVAKEASDLGASDPNAALAKWTEVDRRLTDAAAFLTIGNHKRLDIVSERVGNYQQRRGVGPAISQLWVQ